MLDRARILAISDVYPPQEGDIPNSVQRVTRMVRPFVQSLEVLCFSDELALGTVTTDVEEGISIYKLGISKKPQVALETIGDFISLIHKRNNYQMFHLFKTLYAGYVGVFQGSYYSLPTLLSLRRNELEVALTEPENFPLSRWALNRARALACPTPDLAKRAAAFRGHQKDIFLVPDSVDPHFYQKKKLIELPLPKGRLIGYVGELRVKYGLKILLHSFQIVAKKLQDTHLILMGSMGEEEGRLYYQFVNTSGLQDRIHHYPSLEEEKLPYYLSTFEVFVLPVLRGDVPLMTLKAMACESTLLCSEVGGFQDLISHGVNGYLVPPGNPRALSNQVLKVLKQKNPELGKKAREKILRDHLPQKEREHLLRVYQYLLSE